MSGSPALTEAEIRRIERFVEARLHEPIRVADLAGAVDRSASCFARLFKEATGVTPHRFVVRARVERARAMIDRGEGAGLSAIAVRCGFADQAHLTRAFRRELGQTPAAYCRANGRRIAS
jgi:AraC family transcriptional regulator